MAPHPLQYSCLGNPMDRGAWQAAVHGVAKSRTRLSDFTFTLMHWRRRWQPTSVFLPGESQGQRSLVGCPQWGPTESNTTDATQQQQQQQHTCALKKNQMVHNVIDCKNLFSLIFKLQSIFICTLKHFIWLYILCIFIWVQQIWGRFLKTLNNNTNQKYSSVSVTFHTDIEQLRRILFVLLFFTFYPLLVPLLNYVLLKGRDSKYFYFKTL